MVRFRRRRNVKSINGILPDSVKGWFVT